MRLSKFLVYFLFVLLIGSCFSVFLLSSAQVDSSVLSMSGDGWFVRVDSSLQTSLDSKAVPFTTVSKAGVEKELFLTLNSLKDCVAGRIEFKVQTSGLNVYKQLPLDKELNVTDYDFVNATVAMRKDIVVVSRPQSVVNSFACFDDLGKKVLHIYASKLIDAKGDSVWVDSDLKDGLLTVYLDQKWLESAVFPVVVDPVFGETGIGSSTSGCKDSTFSTRFYLNVGGSITGLTLYGNKGEATYSVVTCGLYNSNGTLLGKTESNNWDSLKWQYLAFDIPISVSAGYYYLSFTANTTWFTPYYDDSLLIMQQDGVQLPQYIDGDTAIWGATFSIYANYYVEPTTSPSPSPNPSSTSITDGELSFSFLFVLGFMVITSIISLVWFGRVPIVPLVVGLFTFLVGLYAGLGGVYSLGVVQGWFSLFVALFGGLTMLLVGLGVRVKK